MDIGEIPHALENQFGWKSVDHIPRFLKKYRWCPKYIFSEPHSKCFIAVELVYHQRLPRAIFRDEIEVAVRENENLRVCILTPAEGEFDVLKSICEREGFGLKLLGLSDITTIIPFSFEKVPRLAPKTPPKEGWFPRVILNGVKELERFSFRESLKDLADGLETTQQPSKQLPIIREHIDGMLQSHPEFVGSSSSFMALSHFENLLNFSDIGHRDHAFHSVRVFLLGCIVIDRFYDRFLKYYGDIFPGTRKESIEYIWLLASIFHDCGRVKEDLPLVCSPDGKRNRLITEGVQQEMQKVWLRDEYQRALGNIVELVKHCQTEKSVRDPFTGIAIAEPAVSDLGSLLMTSYNTLKSHGVVGCFDLAADLLARAGTPRLQDKKTFMLYHIFSAALAIGLHDWHVWADLRELGVFPIRLEDFPFAALLIYLDTFDDFKRGEDSLMSIDELVFGPREVTAHISWYADVEYRKEKTKYESFKKNVLTSDLRFEIKVSNEG